VCVCVCGVCVCVCVCIFDLYLSLEGEEVFADVGDFTYFPTLCRCESDIDLTKWLRVIYKHPLVFGEN
jgi:hypothetical protein